MLKKNPEQCPFIPAKSQQGILNREFPENMKLLLPDSHEAVYSHQQCNPCKKKADTNS